VSELRPHEILLVEDDEVIREATAESLRRDGFEVRMAGTGPDGLAAFREREPSLAILDVMLPGFGGVELCREIRRDSQVPIVFLSARTDAIDIVLGLEAGADDYVTKPFEPAVLAARVRAALRRARPVPMPAGGVNRVGPVAIDRAGHVVTKDAAVIDLTPTEYRLLAELMDNPGVALDRAALLERVWGYGWAGDSRLVDVHIQRLRAKIEDDPTNPELVLTVRGVGYKLARV
jgi:two-component system, OmpR family, response regulator MtrA